MLSAHKPAPWAQCLQGVICLWLRCRPTRTEPDTPWFDRVPAFLIDRRPIAVAVIIGYLALFAGNQGATGQSIGKKVMKFQVVSESTGRPIGFGMSLVRQLAQIADGFACCIGYLFPLWDAKRQTFAD